MTYSCYLPTQLASCTAGDAAWLLNGGIGTDLPPSQPVGKGNSSCLIWCWYRPMANRSLPRRRKERFWQRCTLLLNPVRVKDYVFLLPSFLKILAPHFGFLFIVFFSFYSLVFILKLTWRLTIDWLVQGTTEHLSPQGRTSAIGKEVLCCLSLL